MFEVGRKVHLKNKYGLFFLSIFIFNKVLIKEIFILLYLVNEIF
jgi:hypothetical protein